MIYLKLRKEQNTKISQKALFPKLDINNGPVKLEDKFIYKLFSHLGRRIKAVILVLGWFHCPVLPIVWKSIF